MRDLKPIFISVIIIILIIILDFITVNNTKNIVSSMTKKLENIDELISKDEKADEEIENLIEEWKNKEKLLLYYLEHEETEKICSQIYLLEKQIEIEDIDDAKQSIAETKVLFEHIEEKQILNIENFF